ncbi:MAG TPA: energy transducer TonB [Opitutaceae bacterium]|nr:energy transducer TonB [Opitutaceae bacterium]
MKQSSRILFLALVIAFALIRQASAQVTLFVKQDDKFFPVVAMTGTSPQIMVDGKVVTPQLTGTNYAYALGKAKAYAPIVLIVNKLSMVVPSHTGSQTTIGGETVDTELNINAIIESARPVRDVFLAIEVKGDQSKYNTLITHEVGNLKSGTPVTVDFTAPIATAFTSSTTVFHLFAGGSEVLHTAMPSGQVEREIDQMVQNQTNGVQNAEPAPLICPAPAYPADQTGTGKATVVFTITATGAVTNPVLQDATSPEFGDAALKAVSRWRFLPRMKDGQPVASRVALPLIFKPPAPEQSPH